MRTPRLRDPEKAIKNAEYLCVANFGTSAHFAHNSISHRTLPHHKYAFFDNFAAPTPHSRFRYYAAFVILSINLISVL